MANCAVRIGQSEIASVRKSWTSEFSGGRSTPDTRIILGRETSRLSHDQGHDRPARGHDTRCTRVPSSTESAAMRSKGRSFPRTLQRTQSVPRYLGDLLSSLFRADRGEHRGFFHLEQCAGRIRNGNPCIVAESHAHRTLTAVVQGSSMHDKANVPSLKLHERTSLTCSPHTGRTRTAAVLG